MSSPDPDNQKDNDNLEDDYVNFDENFNSNVRNFKNLEEKELQSERLNTINSDNEKNLDDDYAQSPYEQQPVTADGVKISSTDSPTKRKQNILDAYEKNNTKIDKQQKKIDELKRNNIDIIKENETLKKDYAKKCRELETTLN